MIDSNTTKPTLLEEVTEQYAYSCRKHDLAPDCQEYAEQEINQLSNYELLNAISLALEELNKPTWTAQIKPAVTG